MLELITGCTGGVATIATAIITYLKPQHATKIVVAIGIVATAVIEVATVFLK